MLLWLWSVQAGLAQVKEFIELEFPWLWRPSGGGTSNKSIVQGLLERALLDAGGSLFFDDGNNIDDFIQNCVASIPNAYDKQRQS